MTEEKGIKGDFMLDRLPGVDNITAHTLRLLMLLLLSVRNYN
jgi:hypothetical protein